MGGSSGSAAANAAAQTEGWRNASTNRAVDQINRIYGSSGRQSEINDYLGATREFYGNELNRQKEEADRNLKFAMARSGLSGGSAAADANRTLGENYQQGLLNAERLAQSATGDLRNADETARQNLIAQAANGLSLTSGASQTASALQSNLQAAQSSLRADALGSVFGGLSDVYTRSREAAEERRGFRSLNNGTYFQPGFGYGNGR